jgi:hypothetical protein
MLRSDGPYLCLSDCETPCYLLNGISRGGTLDYTFSFYFVLVWFKNCFESSSRVNVTDGASILLYWDPLRTYRLRWIPGQDCTVLDGNYNMTVLHSNDFLSLCYPLHCFTLQ